MNKEQATKILSKELTKIKGQKFIVNSAYQKHLLENAVSVYEINHEKPFSLQACVDDLNNVRNDDLRNFIRKYKLKIAESCSKVDDANYIFTEHFENLSQTRTLSNSLYSYLIFTNTLSFFALITPQDAEEMKNMFYKNVPLEIVCAVDTLGIMHFIKEYEVYKNTDNFLEALEILKFNKKLTDFISKNMFDVDSEIRKSNLESVIGGIDLLNNRFTSLGIKVSINTRDYRRSCFKDYIHKKNLLQVMDEVNKKLGKGLCQTPEKFYNFVFSLPYEDQNINSNKLILKISAENFDYTYLLVKEYSEGKYFQEYFDCLTHEQQDNIVSALNIVAERKLAHDSFLWTKGFKDIRPDYLEFYKNKTRRFIEYFSDRTTDEKKIILKDIMDLDFVNENITTWLNENHLDLIREVGFNG